MKKRYLLITLLFYLFMHASASPWSRTESDTLKVYPVPAQDYLSIELQTGNILMPEIQIIDLTGKVVLKLEREFSPEQGLFKANLDIRSIKAGIYFLKVLQGDQAYTKKFVVR